MRKVKIGRGRPISKPPRLERFRASRNNRVGDERTTTDVFSNVKSFLRDFMPELPDVELNKRTLDGAALHRPLAGVTVVDDYVLDAVSTATLQRVLEGAQLVETRRHGKQLFARVQTTEDAERWLRLHFGMTGRLRFYEGHSAPEYGYVRFDFADEAHLAFVVPRKIGRVGLVDDPEAVIAAKNLGPDALAVDADGFRERLGGRRGMIKSAFLDQSVIAGLGNIYADEILFQVGVHPRAQVASLGDDTLQMLFESMHEVLQVAIDHEADPNALPADRYLLPHRRGDNRDPLTGAPLETVKVGGRTAYFSPERQTLN